MGTAPSDTDSDDMTSKALMATNKQRLRSLTQEVLNKLDVNNVSKQSSTICSTIVATREYQMATNISIYLSMPTGEVLTDGIVRHALGEGKKVYVPYLYKKRLHGAENTVPRMDMASLHSEEDYKSLKRDKWDIPSLHKSSLSGRTLCVEENGVPQSGNLDLILVPGVAFDADMGRLGHGMGYYDRFIAEYRGKTKQNLIGTRGGLIDEDYYLHGRLGAPSIQRNPHLFGLALVEQVYSGSRVPISEWDYRMDALIVGDGKIMLPQPPNEKNDNGRAA